MRLSLISPNAPLRRTKLLRLNPPFDADTVLMPPVSMAMPCSSTKFSFRPPPRSSVPLMPHRLLHPFLEYDDKPAYLRSLPDPMDSDGFVYLSQQPGLDEDIDFEYIEAHAVSHY